MPPDRIKGYPPPRTGQGGTHPHRTEPERLCGEGGMPLGFTQKDFPVVGTFEKILNTFGACTVGILKLLNKGTQR